MFRQYFEDCCAHFKEDFGKQIRDANKTLPPRKTVTSQPIHQMVYAGVYGKHFLPTEKVPCKDGGSIFQIESVDRLADVLGWNVIMKVREDVTIIVPLGVLVWSVEHAGLSRGRLVIPIKCVNGLTTIFVPSTGPQDSINDEFSLTDIFGEVGSPLGNSPLRLKGKLLSVKSSMLNIHKTVEFQMTELNKHMHGMVNVSFCNVVFDSTGYLVQEVSSMI